MKELVLFATLILCAKKGLAQDLPRIEHDTLFSKSGYNVSEGMLVHLGAGSNTVDGSFIYVKRNEDGPYNYKYNILPAPWKDVRMHVYRVTKRGNKKNGYTYYALLLAHSGPKIQVDIDKTLAAGEIIMPEPLKTSSK